MWCWWWWYWFGPRIAFQRSKVATGCRERPRCVQGGCDLGRSMFVAVQMGETLEVFFCIKNGKDIKVGWHSECDLTRFHHLMNWDSMKAYLFLIWPGFKRRVNHTYPAHHRIDVVWVSTTLLPIHLYPRIVWDSLSWLCCLQRPGRKVLLLIFVNLFHWPPFFFYDSGGWSAESESHMFLRNPTRWFLGVLSHPITNHQSPPELLQF